MRQRVKKCKTALCKRDGLIISVNDVVQRNLNNVASDANFVEKFCETTWREGLPYKITHPWWILTSICCTVSIRLTSRDHSSMMDTDKYQLHCQYQACLTRSLIHNGYWQVSVALYQIYLTSHSSMMDTDEYLLHCEYQAYLTSSLIHDGYWWVSVALWVSGLPHEFTHPWWMLASICCTVSIRCIYCHQIYSIVLNISCE